MRRVAAAELTIFNGPTAYCFGMFFLAFVGDCSVVAKKYSALDPKYHCVCWEFGSACRRWLSKALTCFPVQGVF